MARLNTDFLLRCPVDGKVRAETIEEARRLRRKAARTKGGRNAVRYYQCSAGYWHWTSQVVPKYKSKEPPPTHEGTVVVLAEGEVFGCTACGAEYARLSRVCCGHRDDIMIVRSDGERWTSIRPVDPVEVSVVRGHDGEALARMVQASRILTVPSGEPEHS
jgi:hypothetical protein